MHIYIIACVYDVFDSLCNYRQYSTALQKTTASQQVVPVYITLHQREAQVYIHTCKHVGSFMYVHEYVHTHKRFQKSGAMAMDPIPVLTGYSLKEYLLLRTTHSRNCQVLQRASICAFGYALKYVILYVFEEDGSIPSICTSRGPYSILNGSKPGPGARRPSGSSSCRLPHGPGLRPPA